MSQRNVLDLVFDFSAKFKQIYEVYQTNLKATQEKDCSILHDTIYSYHQAHNTMNTAIITPKHNIHYVKNSCSFSYSNGPIEGINRKKRHCFVFHNLNKNHASKTWFSLRL